MGMGMLEGGGRGMRGMLEGGRREDRGRDMRSSVNRAGPSFESSAHRGGGDDYEDLLALDENNVKRGLSLAAIRGLQKRPSPASFSPVSQNRGDGTHSSRKGLKYGTCVAALFAGGADIRCRRIVLEQVRSRPARRSRTWSPDRCAALAKRSTSSPAATVFSRRRASAGSRTIARVPSAGTRSSHESAKTTPRDSSSARSLYALAIFEREYGRDHPHAVLCRRGLGC